MQHGRQEKIINRTAWRTLSSEQYNLSCIALSSELYNVSCIAQFWQFLLKMYWPITPQCHPASSSALWWATACLRWWHHWQLQQAGQCLQGIMRLQSIEKHTCSFYMGTMHAAHATNKKVSGHDHYAMEHGF